MAMPSTFARFILLFQILANVAIIFDIQYARQIIGFFYLTFIPGLVIVKALKWDKNGLSETIVFSVGLNISLLMFLGLLLNELSLIVAVGSPISVLSLLAATNVIVLLPLLLSHLKNSNATIGHTVLSWHLPVATGIPVLSILGVFAVNNFGNNSLLLLMMVIIAFLVGLGTIYRKALPAKFYPITLFVIAIALLFHSSLITNYLVGWDVHGEYYVFKSTDNVARWNSSLQSGDDRIARGNDMLSVTILPTVYSKITNMDGTWLFKILFPFIFAFVPLTLYQLYCTQAKKQAAFLSIFFLVSNLTFFGVEGIPAKQMVGEFFFVLLFLVLFKERIGTFKRSLLFVIFSAGLVVSHYSLSYIFMFLVSLTWLLPTLSSLLKNGAQRIARISLSKVLIFFAITFAWYIFTSESSSFNAIVTFADQVSRNFLVDFFNPSARTRTVLRGLGAASTASLGHQVGQIVFFISEFLIIVGVARMLFKREYAGSNQDYATLSVLNLTILLMAIIVPNFARFFRMERFYQVSLLLLAPFFVSGGEAVFEFISRRKNQILAMNLLLLVLIPFFLFETGFIYEVTGDYSYSLSLSMYRTEFFPNVVVVHEQEIYGVEWLSKYRQQGLVYSDYFSRFHVLTSYGLQTTENTRTLSTHLESMENGSYTYLRWENIVKDLMIVEELDRTLVQNSTSYFSSWLVEQNKIYSNGGCEILVIAGAVSNST